MNRFSSNVPFSQSAARVAADPKSRLEVHRWIVNPNQAEKQFEIEGPDGKKTVTWTKQVVSASDKKGTGW
jgi:hypothetical protein